MLERYYLNYTKDDKESYRNWLKQCMPNATISEGNEEKDGYLVTITEGETVINTKLYLYPDTNYIIYLTINRNVTGEIEFLSIFSNYNAGSRTSTYVSYTLGAIYDVNLKTGKQMNLIGATTTLGKGSNYYDATVVPADTHTLYRFIINDNVLKHIWICPVGVFAKGTILEDEEGNEFYAIGDNFFYREEE